MGKVRDLEKRVMKLEVMGERRGGGERRKG